MTSLKISSPEARAGQSLGARLATLRAEQNLTLKQLSARTDIPVSTLSKVQNHQATLSYASLQKLARGLNVNIARLFDDVATPATTARRTIIRKGQGVPHAVDMYRVEVLASDLLNKSMHPGILEVPPARPQDMGRLARHPGEEFLYVLDGGIILYSDDYRPVELNAGDSAYLDSTSGHRYVSRDRHTARILVVCSDAASETAEQMPRNTMEGEQTP